MALNAVRKAVAVAQARHAIEYVTAYGERISAADLSAREVAALVRAGELTAAETGAEAATRARAAEGLNAVAVPLFDDAGARAARRGERWSDEPLAGVPISVKESIDVAGAPSTGGVVARAGTPVQRDADLVSALRAAGAMVVAKGNVAQLLWFAETDNPVYGRTSNPWSAVRSPGGSSGGDAALVAAGVVPVAIGTDSGGSIRIPAHWCGVAALKPTSGRLSLGGSLDEELYAGVRGVVNQPGIFARNAGDIELMMGVLASVAGHAGWRAPVGDVAGLRVGVFVDNGVMPPSLPVRRAVEVASEKVQAAGAWVSEFEPPTVAEAHELFDAVFRADGCAVLVRMLEGGQAHPRVAAAIEAARGHAVGPAELAALQGRIARYREAFGEALDRDGLDAVISPVHAVPAVLHGGSAEVIRGQSYTSLWNLLGYPAGVAPVAIDFGLPVGAQVAARPWRDDIVVRLLRTIGEAATVCR